VWDNRTTAPASDQVRLRAAQIISASEQAPERLTVNCAFDVAFEYEILAPIGCFNLSVVLHNQDDVYVLATTSVGEPRWDDRAFPAGLFHSRFRVNGSLLNTGRYRLTLLFVENRNNVVLQVDHVLAFEIHEG